MADLDIRPATDTPQRFPTDNATTSSATSHGQPTETLDLVENAEAEEDENIVYPTGPKLWISISSLFTAMIFVGLDMTIVAVAVPSLTDHFKTISDIGWYSSAYQLVYSSFVFLASQLYSVFSVKKVYLTGICIFQLGSLLCTLAPKSAIFILGRAVAGFGACIMGMGGMVISTYSFPKHKRPLWLSLLSGTNAIAMVSAPLIGGALIDAFSWRACFGINLPFGALTIALTAYGFANPVHNPDTDLPLKDKIRKLDLLSTCVFVPALVSLLIALQWGGSRFGWHSAPIIILFLVFALLISTFGFLQYRRKERATLPPHILKQRTILAGAWFAACCNGILAVVEYFISIYFQGVRGFSASRSGVLGVPLIAGLLVASLASGTLTTLVGYYWPFMFCTSVIAPIATGLLTTLDLDESLAKVLCLLGMLGVGVGFGLNAPVMGVQTVLPNKDVATGVAITGFASCLGSALFLCTSSTLFQNRLEAEIAQHAPGVNSTMFSHGGLSDIRKYVGGSRLKAVLLGYDEAVSQTLYLPVALATLTIIGSIAIERKSVKKKRT